MKAYVAFLETDTIEVAITVTMPLRSWKYVLRDLQGASCPSNDFRAILMSAITAATERIEIVPPGPTTA